MNHAATTDARESRPRKTSTGRLLLIVFGTLAIIFVILQVISASVYSGIVDKSKWSEGKANAGLINSSLKVLRAENSGEVPIARGSYPLPEIAARLELLPAEFDSESFRASNYVITVETPTRWSISVTAADPAKLAGTYTIDQDGVASGTAP